MKLNKKQQELASKKTPAFIRHRWSDAKTHKDRISPEYNKVMELVMDYSTSDTEFSTSRTIHSTVAEARDTLVNFTMNMLFGVKSPWAKIDIANNLLKNKFPSPQQFAAMKKRHDAQNMGNTDTLFQNIFDSNYYTEVYSAMRECDILGTGCYKTIETNNAKKPMYYIHKEFWQYWIVEDEFHGAFHVFEKLEDKRIDELVELYPEVEFPEAWMQDYEDGEMETLHEVTEVVTPIFDPETGDYFYQVALYVGETFDVALRTSYLDYNPYTVFRFSLIPKSPWGKGIGQTSTYAIEKLIHLENQRKLEVAKIIDPPMGALGGKELSHKIDLDPGAWIWLGEPSVAGQNATLQPLQTVSNTLQLNEDIAVAKREIQDLYMTKPLGDFLDQDGAKAKNEIEYRMDMFKQRWSGTGELFEKELLSPAFSSLYNIFKRRNLLIIDKELEDLTVVKFVNLITKTAKLDSVSNKIQFQNAVAQINPQIAQFIWGDGADVVFNIADEMDVDVSLMPGVADLRKVLEGIQQRVQELTAQQQAGIAPQ